jgi:hypothetical protein
MAASSHKKHDLESIDEVCMEKIEKLKVIRDKISQNFLRSESENKHLEKDYCMWDSMSVDAIKRWIRGKGKREDKFVNMPKN